MSGLTALRLAMVLLLLSCVGAGCSAPRDDSIRFGVASAPITFDPRFATDATSARINRLLYEQLVQFDDHLQPTAGIATWQVLDPLHYRFTLLAQRAAFADGSALTSRDVKATYESVLDPATASPHRSTLAMIVRIETPDDDTIDFYLSAPDPLFPGRLVLGIAPAQAIAAGRPLRRAPLGSGAFTWVGWPEEGRVQLQRRRDGQRIEFVAVKDPTVRILKLRRGEIDMLQNDIPPEMVTYARQRPELQVLTARGSNFAYLGFNLNDALVGDRAVRQAIAYGIDREAIIQYMLGGAARPASALLPPDHWAGAMDLPAYRFDPQRARELLRAAGWGPERRPQLIYKTSSDPFRIRLATVIQQQLAAIGIDVVLQTYDWGTFYGDIKAGRFQMFSLSWVGVKTPDIFRYVFHSQSVPPAGANRGHFSDPAVDALIEAADSAADPQLQASAYREIQRRLLDSLPYVPLWYEDNVWIARRDIEGYRIALDGNFDGLESVERRRQ